MQYLRTTQKNISSKEEHLIWRVRVGQKKISSYTFGEAGTITFISSVKMKLSKRLGGILRLNNDSRKQVSMSCVTLPRSSQGWSLPGISFGKTRRCATWSSGQRPPSDRPSLASRLLYDRAASRWELVFENTCSLVVFD